MKNITILDTQEENYNPVVLEPNWYILKVYDNKENHIMKFCSTLRDNGLEFFNLFELRLPHDIDNKPLFPGYLFLKTEKIDILYYQIKQVPYICYWLGFRPSEVIKRNKREIGLFPIPMNNEDLTRFNMVSGLIYNTKINYEILRKKLIPGGVYRIIDGPFKGIECIFRKIVGENSWDIEVQLLIFRRPVNATIPITCIGEE